jgi:hypothetical protein
MIPTVLAHIRSQWMGALALFLVIAGGTAYAAGQIGSSDIANESIRGKDVKDGALAGKDVGQKEFVNFTGNIGVIPAHDCEYKKVTGLPTDNKDHLVLTPEVTTSKTELTYTPKFDESEPGDMWIQVCNHSAGVIDGGTSKFNLLVIDAR